MAIAVPDQQPAKPADPSAAVRRHARRTAVAVAGGVTVAVGIVLLPLPGPGTLVILAGLSILGREFPRARRAADKGKGMAGSAMEGARRGSRRVGGWFRR